MSATGNPGPGRVSPAGPFEFLYCAASGDVLIWYILDACGIWWRAPSTWEDCPNGARQAAPVLERSRAIAEVPRYVRQTIARNNRLPRPALEKPPRRER